jgi:hypothetical protein
MPYSLTSRSPLATLTRIGRTSNLSTREKLKLFAQLRREATRVPTAREDLGFDARDVDEEVNRLRRRVWRGIGPRAEHHGDLQ